MSATITVGRFLYPEQIVHERVLVDVQLIGSPPARWRCWSSNSHRGWRNVLIRLLQAAPPGRNQLLDTIELGSTCFRRGSAVPLASSLCLSLLFPPVPLESSYQPCSVLPATSPGVSFPLVQSANRLYCAGGC
jgi:hypothetical protein